MRELDTGPDALVAEPVTLVNPFTVPPAETEQFLRHWRRSAGIMAARGGFVRACLYRSIADDAERPFVNVAQWSSGAAFDRARANPEFRAEARRLMEAPQLHIAGRPRVYRIAFVFHAHVVRRPTRDDIREHYGPGSGTAKDASLDAGADALAGDQVTLINQFTVSPAESERFLHHWRDSALIMAAQPGAIHGHLYQALDNEVERRFVNVARWASSGDYEHAQANPAWHIALRRMREDPNLHVTAIPALYRAAIEIHASAEQHS